jgi:hypothetical protein
MKADTRPRIDDWSMPLQRIKHYERDANDAFNEKDYVNAEQHLRKIMIEAKYAVEYAQKQIYGEVPPWD